MITKRYNITTTVGLLINEESEIVAPEIIIEKLKTIDSNIIFDNIKVLGENIKKK